MHTIGIVLPFSNTSESDDSQNLRIVIPTKAAYATLERATSTFIELTAPEAELETTAWEVSSTRSKFGWTYFGEPLVNTLACQMDRSEETYVQVVRPTHYVAIKVIGSGN